jgi:flotillin
MGEMRAISASLTVEDISMNRSMFLSRANEFIQTCLTKFGMKLYNMSLHEFTDCHYMDLLAEGSIESNATAAKIAVADSRAKADIGEQERITRSSKEMCRMKTEAAMYDNDRQQQILESKKELAVKEARYSTQISISQLEAKWNSVLKNKFLEEELERKNADTMLEKLRAQEMSHIQVESERLCEMADARLYQAISQSDANYFQQKKEADGRYYGMMKETEAIGKTFDAQAHGVQNLMTSFKDPKAVMEYLMITQGVFEDIAASNAKSIKDLGSSVTVWDTTRQQ